MQKPVYIVEHRPTGKIYDFYDHTWNDTLQECFAPYTTIPNITSLNLSEFADAYVVQVGWVDREDEE